jgi:CheY-like chemotaxis protein
VAKVLVVDDDRGTLDTFAAILSHAGHTATVAATAQEGLQLTAKLPDVILADLRLPDCSGFEFIAAARQLHVMTPIVIMTGWAMRASEQVARQVGAVDFLEKPIDEQVLLAVVRAHAATGVTDGHTPVSMVAQAETRHAAKIWISIVRAVVRSSSDIPTIHRWSRTVGHSVATIRRRCTNAGVSASASLDFARALRIVIRYAHQTCRWFDMLDIVDLATLNRFLGAASFAKARPVPPIDVFLANQAFVREPELLGLVARDLR